MKMKNTLEILQENIVIPDVVMKKANDAFAEIQSEGSQNSSDVKRIHSKNGLFRTNRKKLGMVALAATLVLGTVTAGASVYLRWSRSLEKELRVTKNEKQIAEKSGLADFPEMSVTDGGVTVTAQQSIVDNYYAYLSFKVEGYEVPVGKQPGFEQTNITVDEGDVSYDSSFYDGLMPGEDGLAVLDDGSPIPLDENGQWVIDYTMADGSLEYRINVSGNGEKGFLMNKKIHVELKNLGTYPGKAESVETDIEGSWTFDWVLKGDNSIYTAVCNEPLGNTDATVIGAEISPISIKAIYDFPRKRIKDTILDGETGEKSAYTTYAEPPALVGVKLKDGTLLSNLYYGPGMSGYIDEKSNQYELQFAIDRILDVDQVKSLLFIKSVPEEEGVLTEKNLYVVDIR